MTRHFKHVGVLETIKNYEWDRLFDKIWLSSVLTYEHEWSLTASTISALIYQDFMLPLTENFIPEPYDAMQ